MNRLLTFAKTNFRILREHKELFVGATFLAVGLLRWSHGKYCDGNTAVYYDCTNPAVYYYYGPVAIAAVLFGLWSVILWRLKKGR